ncbi:MAG: AEC family transporter [Candidatus Omnitrophica bacterium]|nr:AEC family transporter [Candidatus Omnitrophota bacterium]
MNFFSAFQTVLVAMIEIVAVAWCGYIFVRRRWISEDALKGINDLLVRLFLPVLTVYHLLTHFQPERHRGWWIYPLLSIGMSLASLFAVRALTFFPFRDSHDRRDAGALIAFQNCGYLPLVFVSGVFPPDIAGELITGILFFMQGFNFLFWGFGLQFLEGTRLSRFSLRKIASPPFVALIVSLALIAARAQPFIPTPLLRAAERVGNCTMPVALLILGGSLAGCLPAAGVRRPSLALAVAGKILVLPLFALAVIILFKVPQSMALLLLIQAAMPSAVNLSVAVLYQKRDGGIISQGVFLTHVLSMVTIPLFLALYAAWRGSW